LEDSLDAYDGTVILVSHDRALLRALTTRTWHLHDQRIEDYPGSFGEWETMDQERSRLQRVATIAAESERLTRERDKERKSEAARKAQSARTRSAKRAAEEAEARVHALEAHISDLTAQLHDPNLYGRADGARDAARIEADIKAARLELDTAMQVWIAATEAIERT
jgi:ATP-binding cassette subfamily F protein 3